MMSQVFWLSLAGKFPCVFREMTGLYCPGCGGTRALKALLRGQWIVSFLYHPLVLYCVMIAVLFAAAYLLYWKTKNPRYRLYLENSYIYAGLGILTLNFVIKNYFLIVKGIDLLAVLPEV